MLQPTVYFRPEVPFGVFPLLPGVLGPCLLFNLSWYFLFLIWFGFLVTRFIGAVSFCFDIGSSGG